MCIRDRFIIIVRHLAVFVSIVALILILFLFPLVKAKSFSFSLSQTKAKTNYTSSCLVLYATQNLFLSQMNTRRKKNCLYVVIFVGGIVSPLTIAFSTLTAPRFAQRSTLYREFNDLSFSLHLALFRKWTRWAIANTGEREKKPFWSCYVNECAMWAI